MVRALLGGNAVRATKLAIADSLRADRGVGELVPGSQVFAVERATIPSLPAVEIIAISSERADTGPMIRHTMSVECTVSAITEDAADEALDGIVKAVRARLADAAYSTVPIALASGEGVLVELEGTRWTVSASDKSSVIRGASIAVSVEVSE